MKTRLFNMSGVYSDESFPLPGADVLDMTSTDGTNCLCSKEAQAEIEKFIGTDDGKSLNLIDTGDYHYISALTSAVVHRDFALVLFDHHPDMAEPSPLTRGMLSCGGWARSAFKDHMKQILLCGINPDLELEFLDLVFEGVLASTEEDGLSGALEMADMLDALPVWLSLDLDVLRPDEFRTDWDQGRMTVDEMKETVAKIARRHEILGIDICGGLTVAKGATDEDLELNCRVRRDIAAWADALLA